MMMDKNWLLNSTFGFALLYPRILDHPRKDIWKFFLYQKMCNRKLVTDAKFHGKILSRSGVFKKNPPNPPPKKKGLKG